MENLELYQENIFESIKHVDESGVKYWEARELMKALKYTKWSNFKQVIEKATISCNLSNYKVLDHFADVGKTIPMPKGASKIIEDYKLSRYACY